MSDFVTFRQKSNGAIVTYPAHYEHHPVFGDDLERYEPSDEYEEDKTVVASHELPVEQRARVTAKPKSTDDGQAEDKKEN